MTIDSTKFNTTELQAKLTALENVLYGTDASGNDEGITPHLPLPDDVLYILQNGSERS